MAKVKKWNLTKTKNHFRFSLQSERKILNVTPLGMVYRIVIVFNALGIQQFYKNLNFADYITDFEFFNPNELDKIFSKKKYTKQLTTNYLDNSLLIRFKQ